MLCIDPGLSHDAFLGWMIPADQGPSPKEGILLLQRQVLRAQCFSSQGREVLLPSSGVVWRCCQCPPKHWAAPSLLQMANMLGCKPTETITLDSLYYRSMSHCHLLSGFVCRRGDNDRVQHLFILPLGTWFEQRWRYSPRFPDPSHRS